VLWEGLGFLVQQGHLVQRVPADNKGPQAQQAVQALLEDLELLEVQDLQVEQDSQDSQAHQVLLDQVDHRVPRGLWELRDLLVQ